MSVTVEFIMPPMRGGPHTILLPAVPRVGEDVYFDGSDPDVAEGSWRVRNVVHFVGLRGTTQVRVVLGR